MSTGRTGTGGPRRSTARARALGGTARAAEAAVSADGTTTSLRSEPLDSNLEVRWMPTLGGGGGGVDEVVAVELGNGGGRQRFGSRILKLEQIGLRGNQTRVYSGYSGQKALLPQLSFRLDQFALHDSSPIISSMKNEENPLNN
ncbi:hypothetical protein NL676_022785 [Syzygium grande]|nr:hypothetical protein NL676_022785 [Syzygium grande]